MHTPDARRNPRVSRAVIATTESPTCAAASGAFERFGNAALPSWLDEPFDVVRSKTPASDSTTTVTSAPAAPAARGPAHQRVRRAGPGTGPGGADGNPVR